MQVEPKRACGSCGSLSAPEASFCWRSLVPFAHIPPMPGAVPDRPRNAVPPVPLRGCLHLSGGSRAVLRDPRRWSGRSCRACRDCGVSRCAVPDGAEPAPPRLGGRCRAAYRSGVQAIRELHRRRWDRRRALERSPREATPPLDRARHDHELIGRRRSYRRWFRSGVTRSIGRCAQQLKPSLYTERTVRHPGSSQVRPSSKRGTGGPSCTDSVRTEAGSTSTDSCIGSSFVLRPVVEVVRWRADTRHAPHPNASRAKASQGGVPAQRGGYDEQQRAG
jgi:hypothetical protein